MKIMSGSESSKYFSSPVESPAEIKFKFHRDMSKYHSAKSREFFIGPMEDIYHEILASCHKIMIGVYAARMLREQKLVPNSTD